MGLDYVSVTFPVVVIKIPSKNNLQNEGFILSHNSRVQVIMVGKNNCRGLK